MQRIHPAAPFVIISVLLFFIPLGQEPSSPFSHLMGFAHLAYFALLARSLAWLPPVNRRQLWQQIPLVMAIVLVSGGAIELIQPIFGRSASWTDLGIDLLGGLTGLLFLTPACRSLPLRVLAGSRLAVLAMGGLAFSGPVAALWDMGQAVRQFPLLGDFERRLEASRWSRGEIDHRLARHGRSSLRVDLGVIGYTGTALSRSLGQWQGYTSFAFSVYNPDPEPLRLTVSIRDQEHYQGGGEYHDRFNRAFQVRKGWNDFQIPLGEIADAPLTRTMDLAKLREVLFFARNLPAPRVIYLDHVRLLP